MLHVKSQFGLGAGSVRTMGVGSRGAREHWVEFAERRFLRARLYARMSARLVSHLRCSSIFVECSRGFCPGLSHPRLPWIPRRAGSQGSRRWFGGTVRSVRDGLCARSNHGYARSVATNSTATAGGLKCTVPGHPLQWLPGHPLHMGLEFSARTRGPETMPWKRMDVDEERMRFVIGAVSGQERLAGLSGSLGFRGRRAICGGSGIGKAAVWRIWRSTAGGRSAVRGARPGGKRSAWWPCGSRPVGAPRNCACCCARNSSRICRCAPFTAFWNVTNCSAPPAMAQRRSVSSAARRTSCGRWTARGSIRCGMASATRCRSWTITAAMRWGCTRCRSPTAAQAHPCLVQTFRRYGVPQAMLTDHGSLWWATTTAGD